MDTFMDTPVKVRVQRRATTRNDAQRRATTRNDLHRIAQRQPLVA
jgi:hypothetical protein